MNSNSLAPHRSPRMRRLADQLAHIRISLDPPSPPCLSPSPLGDLIKCDERRMTYLQVPGVSTEYPDFLEHTTSLQFNSVGHRSVHSPPPDRRTSFASTMSDTNSSITIPMSSSYQNLLSPMWSTMKYSSDDCETPPNEPSPRRSKSALSNRSSSDCINVPPIVFSPVLSRPMRSVSPTSMLQSAFRSNHGSDSESESGIAFAQWRGSGSGLMIPRRSFNHQQQHHNDSSSDHSSGNMGGNMDRLLKRNRRKTMAIHGVDQDSGSSNSGRGWTSASMTNLCRVRSSLGHSDPQLSSNTNNTSASSLHPKYAPSSSRSSIVRPSSNASTSPTTMQRCKSPIRMSQRSASSSQNFAVPSTSTSTNTAGTVPITLRSYSTRNGSSLMAPAQDTRRWSLASLPSTSGYGTPGTGSNSGVSSQYSSSEQIGEMVENMRVGGGGGGPVRQASSRFDSNESYEEVCTANSSNSWLNRPRSRSLTSPMKFMNEYNLEMLNRTSVYKERFPKAKAQMEERLKAFVGENGPLSGGHYLSVNRGEEDDGSDDIDDVIARSRRSTVLDAESYADRSLLRLIGDGATRFLHHQIVEIAADCLSKSNEDLITCSYFCEMSQRLEETLNEAQIKTSPESFEYLSKLVKKLLMIVSRPARLLECLEFNPDEFYQLLEEAEGVVREQLGSGTARVPDLPQYIIGKLGLDRDPLLESTDGDEHGDEDVVEKPFSAHPVLKNEKSDNWSDSNRAPCEDDFDTIRLVSNGAYGAVYLVRHRETRQRFALKKMNKQTLMLRNQVDQVFAERDILTMADNPFVVSFYGSFETKQYLCMLMEYVEGGDCAALLKSAVTLPIELTRLYIAETILAIEYLHSYGIVHRDLKPDNLLITSMGHIKLTDFGLSKIGLMNRTTLVAEGYEEIAETQQFQDKQLCGTPEYIAPEVILRRGYGKPVDWWALGIILYEFLVGIVPFFADSPEVLFSKVINEEVEYPEDEDALPPESEDLCRRLLEKNPAERLGTHNGASQLMAHPFFQLLDFTSLLRQKAEFVPQLDNEEDTSYFDARTDRYNHEAESCEDDAATAMMFHSFSTASPRHSIVSIDPSQLPNVLFSGPTSSSGSGSSHSAREIERSNSISSSGRGEVRTERSFSTGQASDSMNDDPMCSVSAVNLRRRFSAQRHKVSTTSSSGTGSGTCFATAASSTDSSIDASSLPVFNVRETGGKGSRSPLPRFAISCEGTTSEEGQEAEIDPVRFRNPTPSNVQIVIPPTSSSIGGNKETCYVMCSNPVTVSCQLSPGGVSVSSASSTDIASPVHPSDAHASSSEPQPTKCVTIRKGPFGFGFTLKSVRVYLGEHSEYYTIEHIVTAVVEGSPAFAANLQAEDMITHVNGHTVHNLTHPQLMHRLLSNGNELVLTVTPLSATSIKEGAARRTVGKLAKKKPKRPQRRVPLEKKSRKPSALLRRLSGKRATNDIVPGSSSQKQTFMPRSASSQDGTILTHLPGTTKPEEKTSPSVQQKVKDLELSRPSSLRGNAPPSSSSSSPSSSHLNPSSSSSSAIPVARKSKFTEPAEPTTGVSIVKQKSQSIAVSPLARETRIRSPSPSAHRPQSSNSKNPANSPLLSLRRRSYQPTSATPAFLPTQQQGSSSSTTQNLLNRILPQRNVSQRKNNDS